MVKQILLLVFCSGIWAQDITLVYKHRGTDPTGGELSNELFICLQDSFTVMDPGTTNNFVFFFQTLEIPGIDSLTVYSVSLSYTNMFGEPMVVSSTLGYCASGKTREAAGGVSQVDRGQD